MTSVSINETHTNVVVENDTRVIVAEVETGVVIKLTGVGPQGPPGPAGTGFVFTNSKPSDTWTINHNLGFRPIVEAFDSGSQVIDAAVSHPSVNTAVILFSIPVAGFARLI